MAAMTLHPDHVRMFAGAKPMRRADGTGKTHQQRGGGVSAAFTWCGRRVVRAEQAWPALATVPVADLCRNCWTGLPALADYAEVMRRGDDLRRRAGGAV